MIINPIIPIWLMAIICIILAALVIYNKQLKEKIQNKKDSIGNLKQKDIVKKYILSVIIKISIIILLFVINLRFMLPNGESVAITSDLSILFVIDTSVSMRALDYNGNKERFEGVINDCCNIVDELSNCKFSIITFGDTVKKLIPFTTDTDMVQAELQSISLESDFYAHGTSINLVKDTLEKTLKKEYEKQNGNSKIILFFVSDGEITKENEKLASFANMKQYILDGAVLGYGTIAGGRMINSIYKDQPSSEFYYIYYYDDNFNKVTALSKIDEKNLKQIAQDLGIDYIQMNKSDNINYKFSNIKRQITNTRSK